MLSPLGSGVHGPNRVSADADSFELQEKNIEQGVLRVGDQERKTTAEGE